MPGSTHLERPPVRRGETLENPVSGERCTWHLTAADTDGRLVRAELRIREGGGMRRRHLHRRAQERFEVLSGRLAAEVGGDVRIVERGEQITLPAGVAHRWWNAGEGELHLMLEVAPPGHFEDTFATLSALARAGRLRADGRPGLLHLAVLARRWPDDAHLTRPPVRAQRLLLAALAPLGRLRGHRPPLA